MDPDMNKYDLEHVTTGHPVMTAGEWQEVYRRAWDLYYSAEQSRRSSAAPGVGHQAGAPPKPYSAVLLHLPAGERASAAGRLFPAQIAPRAPRRPAPRNPDRNSISDGSARSSQPTSSSPPSTSICTASAAASSATRDPTNDAALAPIDREQLVPTVSRRDKAIAGAAA